MAFGLLLPGFAVPAHAVTPEVTASENPVLIAFPHFPSKDITLTWKLDPFQVANLSVTEDGAPMPDRIVGGVASGQGTEPLTVAYGKTYVVQLRQTLGGRPLGAPITITTDKPEIDTGCVFQCITGVEVQPHGGWAQFTIKTNQKAVLTLEAGTAAPGPDGTWGNPNDVTASNGAVLPTDSWTPPLANLNPGTTYHYVVRARENGHESVRTGSFKTLTRRVDVNFADVQMIDDSDGPFDGDCDCWFWFGAGDQLPKQWGDHQNQISVGSGTTVHPNVKIGITNAPNEILLGTIAHDDDQDPLEFCSIGVGPPVEGQPVDWEISGDAIDCLDYAGSKITVKLSRQGPPFSPGDVDEQFTEAFTIKVDGQLAYNVRGTYKVSYVA